MDKYRVLLRTGELLELDEFHGYMECWEGEKDGVRTLYSYEDIKEFPDNPFKELDI